MMRVRCGGYQGAASVHTLGLQALADALARHGADTSVLPDVTADGSKATALLTQVEAGAMDLCYFASSYLAARVPALAVFDLPFALPDRAAAYRALDGALGQAVAAAVRAATGFAVLGFWDNGFRHLSNRLRPLRGPEDCTGLSIRTLDSRVHHQVFAGFGFRPVTIDVRDLAEAVRSGRVDAQENPLTNTVNFGLHRTHRFHSLTSHFFGVAPLLVNAAWHESLASASQAVLRQAVAMATAVQRQAAAAEDARCLALLQADGAEILGPEALDMPAFQRVAGVVLRQELNHLDPAIAGLVTMPH